MCMMCAYDCIIHAHHINPIRGVLDTEKRENIIPYYYYYYLNCLYI